MKKLKIITITLLIILITLISFFGVYIKTQNRMENKVKDYNFSKEIEGGRIVELQVVTGKADDEAEEEKTEETEEEKVQTTKPEDLTIENFETVKATLEKRLDSLGAQDYTISLNESNGKIIVELSEDNNTDTYIYYLTASRKTVLTEKDTENELLTDEMIEGATYSYSSNMEGMYRVRAELELSKEGQAKLQEILKDYAVLATEVEEIEAEQASKEKEEEKEEEAKEDEEATQQEKTEEVPVEEETPVEETAPAKKIAVLTIGANEYEIDKIEKDKIIIKVGGDTTRTSNANNNIAVAAEICMLIEAGQVPVNYEIENNRYVYSEISDEYKMYFVISMLAIFTLILLIIIIKYKTRGLLVAISFVGFTSTFLLILRYANVLISMEGILAIIITLIINLVLNIKILKRMKIMSLIKEVVKGAYKDVFLKIIPVIILIITFCFSGWANLSSFGMIMFWGLVLIAIYNIIITKTLLELKENK